MALCSINPKSKMIVAFQVFLVTLFYNVFFNFNSNFDKYIYIHINKIIIIDEAFHVIFYNCDNKDNNNVLNFPTQTGQKKFYIYFFFLYCTVILCL